MSESRAAQGKRPALDFLYSRGLTRDRTPSPPHHPLIPLKRLAPATPPGAIKLSPRTAAAAGFSDVDLDMSWGWDDDDELVLSVQELPQGTPSPVKGLKLTPRTAAAAGFSQVIDLTQEDDAWSPSPTDLSKVIAVDSPSPPRRETSAKPALQLSPRTAAAAGFPEILDFDWDDDEDSTEGVIFSPAARADMPPPSEIPSHFKTPLKPLASPAVEETPPSVEPTQFPIRRRRRLASSPPPASPASTSRPLRRLRRRQPSSPADAVSPAPPAPPARRSRPGASSRPNPPDRARAQSRVEAALMDLDAGVSGSESSDESSGEEDESDRRFAGDFAPTQAPRDYNQRAVYAAGLNTQACARQGLRFGDDSDSRAANFLAKARKAVLVSDDEGEVDSENEYELGSFVCDDEDVVFTCK